MNKYKIYKTKEFENDFSRLDKSIKIQIDKEIEQLEENPFRGKPLGYKFFREKKAGNYRFYYLIYEDLVVVFLIAISDKKDQQGTVNAIKSLIPNYKEEIRKRLILDK